MTFMTQGRKIVRGLGKQSLIGTVVHLQSFGTITTSTSMAITMQGLQASRRLLPQRRGNIFFIRHTFLTSPNHTAPRLTAPHPALPDPSGPDLATPDPNEPYPILRFILLGIFLNTWLNVPISSFTLGTLPRVILTWHPTMATSFAGQLMYANASFIHDNKYTDKFTYSQDKYVQLGLAHA